MSGFNNIPTPPFKSDFMKVCKKNIGVYRSQQQVYGHPLTIIHVQKDEERGKTTWGKSSLKKGHERQTKNVVDVD